eukprot:COSAG01_NODE_3766_length_5718_cov_26.287774_1_plen_206_part_00
MLTWARITHHLCLDCSGGVYRYAATTTWRHRVVDRGDYGAASRWLAAADTPHLGGVQSGGDAWMRRTSVCGTRTVPRRRYLESSTTAPLTLHGGVRGWARDDVRRPDDRSRRSGGDGVYVLSALRGLAAQPPLPARSWVRRFAARGGRHPPRGAMTRREQAALDHHRHHHGDDDDHDHDTTHTHRPTYITTCLPRPLLPLPLGSC